MIANILTTSLVACVLRFTLQVCLNLCPSAGESAATPGAQDALLRDLLRSRGVLFRSWLLFVGLFSLVPSTGSWLRLGWRFFFAV